jgi:hypothetical protein
MAGEDDDEEEEEESVEKICTEETQYKNECTFEYMTFLL